MRKNPYSISRFVCPVCDAIVPLPRFKGQRREKKHKKDIYCPKCKQDRVFVEYRDKDFYKTMEGGILGV